MFEKFSVIDLIKTRSASVCTFAGNIVKFNVQTAQELHFPEYIQFLIEPKSKQYHAQPPHIYSVTADFRAVRARHYTAFFVTVNAKRLL